MTFIDADFFKSLSFSGPIFKEDGSFDLEQYFKLDKLKSRVRKAKAVALRV